MQRLNYRPIGPIQHFRLENNPSNQAKADQPTRQIKLNAT